VHKILILTIAEHYEALRGSDGAGSSEKFAEFTSGIILQALKILEQQMQPIFGERSNDRLA
jgi:hypothetical protein